MALSKSLMTILTVLLVVGGGVAAVGITQTDTDDTDASTSTVSRLAMDATLDNETVTVTVMDDGTAVENASVVVEDETDITVTTDANGTATVNRSALTEDGESLEELEITYESDHVEGELEFLVQNDSLTLVEEKYEYDVEEPEDEEDEEEDDDENEDVDEDETDADTTADN